MDLSTIHHDYAEDIKQCKLTKLIELLRKGEASILDCHACNTLADYLEGKIKRKKGRPSEGDDDKAFYLRLDYWHLREYGLTVREEEHYISAYKGNLTSQEEILSSIAKPMKHGKAIDALCERNSFGKILGKKNVERLIEKGKRIHLRLMDHYYEELSEEELRLYSAELTDDHPNKIPI